jgi:trigger factor
VTFPEGYAVTEFAGKEAVFEVDVKEVRARLPIVLDDELGKAVGLESLAELREEVQQQLRRDYDVASRLRLKRVLLDKLAAAYDFPVPPGMVDLEFDSIWRRHEAEQESQTGATPEEADTGGAQSSEATIEAGSNSATIEAEPSSATIAAEPASSAGEGPGADAAGAAGSPANAPPAAGAATDGGESEEDLKADYRRIAERRVRLGLLLAEVGRNNNITVTQDELNQAIGREARRHPGYERQVLDFYRQNPEAVVNLRAPIFEDKVIDFIVELAKIEERRITPQELLNTPDPDERETPAA